MTKTRTMEERISQSYPKLSEKLRVAADYVAENPIEIATRSLRSVAGSSGVSPATYSRLARALGYADYEEMREDGRASVGRRLVPFSDRTVRDGQLEPVIDALHAARYVLLVGSLGSSGFMDYLGYLAHWFNANWFVAGRNGTPLAASMSRLDGRDVVVVLTKAPYARRTILALRAARRQSVLTVVITDSYTSPALEFADHPFIVPAERPQFFSSYAATLVLFETIISMLLARRGDDAEELIRLAENQIHNLGETWSP